jgi:hypothetical protein
MARRFDLDDGLPFSASCELSESIGFDVALLDMIPKIEADIIHLHYFRGKTQTDIARIFSIKQSAVHYRIRRGLARIKFLMERPPIDEDRLRSDLRTIGLDNTVPGTAVTDIDILITMYHSTCQSVVASQLDLTQGLVRHRFLRAVSRIQDEVEEPFITYGVAFRMIRENLNILHEVNPQHPFARASAGAAA